ncbi:MAG: hypothetical protein ACI35Q_07180 [Marinilabiliaceae bacterium]
MDSTFVIDYRHGNLKIKREAVNDKDAWALLLYQLLDPNPKKPPPCWIPIRDVALDSHRAVWRKTIESDSKLLSYNVLAYFFSFARKLCIISELT